MTKKELRSHYRQLRKAIPAKDRMKWNDLLLIQFQQLSFSNISVMFSYWPMEQEMEPDTLLFSNYLKHLIPGLAIAYPVVNRQANEMLVYAVDEDTDWQESQYGISEPVNGRLLHPEDIDMILVPQLICDKQGYRVGYGKGYYDRYIANCRHDVLKVGVNYFEPVEKIDDAQSFDIPLNYCITPEKIYEF